MAEETYTDTYKGHDIYYYRYIEGGVFGSPDVSGHFSKLADLYAAIDKLEAPPTRPDVGSQEPTTPTRTPAATYRGVTVYTDSDLPGLFFSVNGVEYKTLLGEGDAVQIIDGLLGPLQPGEPGYVYVSPLEPSEIPLPSGWGWLASPLNWLKSVWDDHTKKVIASNEKQTTETNTTTRSVTEQLIAANEKRLQDYAKPAGLGGWLWGGFVDTFKEITSSLTKPLQDAGKNALDQALAATGEHSMDPTLKAKVDALLKQIREQQEKAIAGTRHSAVDQLAALEAAWELAALYSGSAVSLEVSAAATDLVHPIKLIQARSIVSKMLDRLHLDKVTDELINMPTDKGLLKPIEKYYNAMFTPELPGYGDLQNMRMKEIIGQTEFEDTMKYHGYAPDWSRKMWDAHFIPPSLADILTAWRRGIPVKYPKSDPATGTIVWVQKDKLDESDVRYLLESIDLDPRYIDIFETRKYVDPPLSITRFMFEEGVIGADTVHSLVELQGYRPEHVEYITKYITEFQERLWRRRYLVTLQGGYQKGVYTAAELEKAVLDAGYTPDVALWIRENADARKKIAESAVAVEEKAKLLSVGDLKKLYIENMITRDVLQTEIAVRGYPLDQAELLIKLLDQEKVVESAGGSKVALSQAELVDAWRYDEISEDQLRTELQLRGLSLAEVEILIRTKKKKWGVEEQ